MKVALVIHDFDPHFGQGRHAVELASRLVSNHEVHVYANRFAAEWRPLISFQKVPAMRKNALTTILSFAGSAERLLARQSYDIIHAQGLTCWRADVITAHICVAARALREQTGRWQDWLFYRLAGPLEKRFYQGRQARHLIAVSRRVGAEISRIYGWKRAQTVVYHGIDTHEFRPVLERSERLEIRGRFGLKSDGWVWLFIGEANKGLRLAIEQLPSFPAATLLAISRSDLRTFKRLARQLGVSNRVIFWGPEIQTATAYRGADVFVYPSAYDAFGLVVAEAMASGLPVIVGEHLGVAEWIKPGDNGLICDPCHPEALRSHLEWIQANPTRARAMGQAARASVEHFSWDACAEATSAVYQKVVAEKQPA